MITIQQKPNHYNMYQRNTLLYFKKWPDVCYKWYQFAQVDIAKDAFNMLPIVYECCPKDETVD